MKCPECSKEIEIPDYAAINVETYGNSQTIKVDCCGKIVRLTRTITLVPHKLHAQPAEDAWGNT